MDNSTATTEAPKPVKPKKSLAIKIARIVGIVVLVCAVIIGLIGLLINLIMTPERLTPIVLQVANEYVDGEVSMDEVDVTFFSSFPRMGIRLRGGRVISNAFLKNDTIRTPRDTLAVFDELLAGINIGNYLAFGDVIIGLLRVKNAEFHLFCDKDSICNWDIVKSDSTEVTLNDSIEIEEEDDMEITVKRIKLINCNLKYTDMTSKTSVFIDSLNLTAKGDMKTESLDIDIELDDKRTLVYMDGSRYLPKVPVHVKGNIHYDAENEYYAFEKTLIEVSKTGFVLDGWVSTDSLGVNMDMKFGLKLPSVETLFSYLPLDRNLNVEDGSVKLRGTAVGRLADHEIPVVTLEAKVSDVKASYEGMPYGIDTLEIELNALVDGSQPKSSYANLDIFRFHGGESSVEASVKVSELLYRPLFDLTLKAHLDLPSLTEIFPVEGNSIKGSINADLTSNFRLRDIRQGNYGRIRANGRMSIDTLELVNDSMRLTVKNDTRLRFSGEDTLSIDAMMRYLKVDFPGLKFSADWFKIDGKTLMEPDTTAIVTVMADLYMRRFFMKSDTIVMFGKTVKSHNVLMPSAADKTKPYVEINLSLDTLFSGIYGTRAFTQGLNSEFMLSYDGDSTWSSKGLIALENLRVGTPVYGLPITVKNAKLTQGSNVIKIEQANVRAGSSVIDIKGEVKDLYRSIATRSQIVARMNVKADTLNLNELMGAVVEDYAAANAAASNDLGADTMMVISTAADSLVTTDSIPQRVFGVPPILRFTFTTQANRIIWNKTELEKMKGKIEIIKGAIHMTDLQFSHVGSKAFATLAYKPNMRENTAQADVFLRWEKADVASLVKELDLDTIIPMLEPLRGKVDCYLAAQVDLDSVLNYDLNKIRASMHLGAQKITIMDGETFSTISKVLMFKNKEENVIDTLALNILIDTGYLQILPFVANIDRYRACIGGGQDFDMNINYHISILKSPLPFKAGVTLTGNIDDFDIDITTAKLKKKATQEVADENDSISLAIRQDILRHSYELSGLEIPAILRSSAARDSILAARAARSLAALSEPATEADSTATQTEQ